MLINLFFSLSILVSQLYTTDTFEFTVFNKTVLIQDTAQPNDNQRIDSDGMIERTYYLSKHTTDNGFSFTEAFRQARAEKGPGNTFVWNNRLFTTNYYYETIIVVGDEIIDVDEDKKIYKTDERLSDVVAVRSFKDSDKYEINYSFLNMIVKK